MFVTMVIASNSLLAQDTSHTKLVDKFYPESKAPELPLPTLNKGSNGILNNEVDKSTTSTTISQAPQIEKAKVQVPVASPTVAQDSNSLNPVHNTNSGIGTDNYNPDPSSPIYRDTRLGSSSPLYDTYKKNDNGAGSITTNPNKG